MAHRALIALSGIGTRPGVSATNAVRPVGRTRRRGPEGGVVTGRVASVLRQLPGQRVTLPATLRAPMGQAFGADFRALRVHSGQGAAALRRDLGARAFTLGSVIVLGAADASGDRPTHARLGHQVSMVDVIAKHAGGGRSSIAWSPHHTSLARLGHNEVLRLGGGHPRVSLSLPNRGNRNGHEQWRRARSGSCAAHDRRSGGTDVMAERPRDQMRGWVGRDLLAGRRALITGGDSGRSGGGNRVRRGSGGRLDRLLERARRRQRTRDPDHCRGGAGHRDRPAIWPTDHTPNGTSSRPSPISVAWICW